jgi:ubiquinone biosynthesis protein UbiJ
LVLKIKSTEKDAEIDALKQRLDALEKRFNQMLTKSNK